MTKTTTVHAQQKWEFMEMSRRTETYLMEELNEVGQQGWELVSVTHAKDRKGDFNWFAFLKRPCRGSSSSKSEGSTSTEADPRDTASIRHNG